MSATVARAQETPDPLCVEVAKVPIPKADLPATPPPAKCDAWGMYYEGGAVNWRKARECALAEEAKPSTDDKDMVGDAASSSVLIMVYANGRGVAPNLRLAERFACETQDWDGDGRDVAHRLEDARQKGALRLGFDICDHVLGRLTNYACIVRDQGRVDQEKPVVESRFNVGTVQQRAAFGRLVAARSAFLKAHAAEEPNGTTGAVQSAMQEEVDMDRAWVDALKDFGAGKLPQASASEFHEADEALNAAYREAMKLAVDCTGDVCLTTEELKTSERAWLAYREAWVEYGAVRWPAVPAIAWRKWLSEERTKDLSGAD